MNPSQELQHDFLANLAEDGQFHYLFDHLAGISFFAKNAKFQIVCANRNFLARLDRRDEESVIGMTDDELFPKPLADKFRADDETVLRTGEPMLNLVEMFLNVQGIPDWYLTNKLPVFDREGNTIGVMGTVQRHDQQRSLLTADPAIAKAIEMIRSNLADPPTIPELARAVGSSQRHFDRKFSSTFGIGPQQFIAKTRIQAACDALRKSGSNISDVALNLGFYDQSAFTAQFRRHMGITPGKYQRQYRV